VYQGLCHYVLAGKSAPSIHGSIASDERGIRPKKVGHPPCLEQAVAGETVGDPQPPEHPVRERPAEVEERRGKSDCHRSEIDQRRGEQFAGRKRDPDPFHVVECSERNPILERREKDNEALKRQQFFRASGYMVSVRSSPLAGLRS
jgi:hypothetical protein